MEGKFKSGGIYMTVGVSTDAENDPEFRGFITESLKRHLGGDWGEVCDEDRAENEFSLKEGLRLMSVYSLKGRKIWIITEADRSATTILYPENY